jgi:hypothetical protein
VQSLAPLASLRAPPLSCHCQSICTCASTAVRANGLSNRRPNFVPHQAGARDTVVLPNPDVPVTIYTEAVAKQTYGKPAVADKITVRGSQR